MYCVSYLYIYYIQRVSRVNKKKIERVKEVVARKKKVREKEKQERTCVV